MTQRLLLFTIAVASVTLAYSRNVVTTESRLEDGTPVKLRLRRTLSSAPQAQVNERVDFDVLEQVKVNGAVVISKGSIALGTITSA